MKPLKPLGSPKLTHTTPSTVPVLSPLAAFAKQQRDNTEGSQSNDRGKVSALASFAKSHHQQQSTVPHDDLLLPSSAATSASRPTLQRLNSTAKLTGSLAPLPLSALSVSKKPEKQDADHALATETGAKQEAAHENEKPQDKDTEETSDLQLFDEAEGTEVSGTDEGHTAEENASSASEDFQIIDSDDESGPHGCGDKARADAKTMLDAPTAEADLYASVSEEQGTVHLTRPALAKIFVPKASEIPLFQAILAHDERFLENLLEEMTPEEILSVRDVEQRSLYHYAALCRSKRIKALVFSHVNRYHDRELDLQVQPLLERSHQVHAIILQTNESRLERKNLSDKLHEIDTQTCFGYASATTAASDLFPTIDLLFFRQAAVSPTELTVEQEPHLLSVLQRHLSILSRKDASRKTPLHYAIESGNMRQMQWLFQVGAYISLRAKDVQELAHLAAGDAVRIQFLQNVQALDAINFKLRFDKENCSRDQVEEGDNGDDNDADEHGISIYLSATLERDTKTQSGPLLQSPLLKAAMLGNIEAAKLLLTKGADPMARDANG